MADEPSDEAESGLLSSRVKLQTNFTSFGMVRCLFTYDSEADVVTLDAEDDSKHYLACPLAALGPVKYTRGESRFVFHVDGQKYRLVFQSGGNILASTAARRFAGSAARRKIVRNNGYDDWFALLAGRGHIS